MKLFDDTEFDPKRVGASGPLTDATEHPIGDHVDNKQTAPETYAVGEDPHVRWKIARLAAGKSPRVLDLFAGCGGLSLGFHRAGFEISAAVEHDPDAAASHGANFHPGDPLHAIARNILELTPERLVASVGLGPPALAIDVLVGGPPCQAFARVGRSKLREIDAHPQAFMHDPRARLYLEYLRYVRTLKPLALVMENVPDVLNHGGQNIAEETCEVLEECGYNARYSLLNAAYYGVPQMRERMILIAYRKELTADIEFPHPTHWVDLPPGYRSSRRVALKLVDAESPLNGKTRYVPAPVADPSGTPAVTAEAALADLAPMTEHLEGKSRRGVRRLEGLSPYSENAPVTSYAGLMRDWPGFAAADKVSAHVTRHLPRDWRIFAKMAAGDQYPEAHAHAQSLFEEELKSRLEAGECIEPETEAYETFRSQFVPPYDAKKFPNKWRKMEADRPARTLMAHLGKDTYSHIHYDSGQARTISVREAARLQSFPDGFIFRGTMNPAFRQIGNAVPPLLAAAVAATIYETLKLTVSAKAREPALTDS